MDRRTFLQGIAIAATVPQATAGRAAPARGFGPMRRDPAGILDLPEGFSYQVVSRAGEPMADGLRVPGSHDGMAAFDGDDGKVVLVCNHELAPAELQRSAFAGQELPLPAARLGRIYDAGGGRTPGAGGTTTTVYDPATQTTVRQHLSLAGTELNCAGGRTPWNSWLSCEECFTWPGERWGIRRERPHGYVFEVPADADGLVDAEPIRAMGRFEHEAAAVHEASGVVYLTEDKYRSLMYRYLPDVPGQLQEGGRLQALAVPGRPSMRTDNWLFSPDLSIGDTLPTEWIDLSDVDSDRDDLRQRGADAGAAIFARGEGLCIDADDLYFSCTIGGTARLGQVFHYRASAFEGTAAERDAPGELTLIAEAGEGSVLQNADNMTVAPWGDLVICEDSGWRCGLVGFDAAGGFYELADNAYSASELAGVCFSPDGKVLFVNIQYPGMTLAITGPWPAAPQPG